MKIAGIYPCPFDPVFRHDANVAIITESQTYAYEEAKLVQTKDYGNCIFPEKSLSYGLKELGLRPDEIDLWVLPSPSKHFSSDGLLSFFKMIKAIPRDEKDSAAAAKWIKEHVCFQPHSLMHAGLAAYTSPTTLDYILVMDGGGDEGDPTDILLMKYSETGLLHVHSTRNSQGLGKFHTFITDQLGFAFNSNGKVSGLAAYGELKSKLYALFEQAFSISASLDICFDRKIVRRGKPSFSNVSNDNFSFIKYINPPPGPTGHQEELGQFKMEDIARTAETFLHDKVCLVLDSLFRIAGVRDPIRLGLAGGLFNNVALNKAIADHPLVASIHTTMAPGDSGLALGGVLLEANKKALVRTEESAFLGPSFSDEEIELLLQSYAITYQRSKNVSLDVAKLLSEESIVGWFQGRAEYGPRSLGARSILAHPGSGLAKERVNQLVKRRDWFMPFAPAVIDQFVPYYFERPCAASPYMQVALNAKPSALGSIASGVHVDGSSRVQVVSREANSLFYDLVSSFCELTTIGAVLNTSFNRHGIATISTPRQALDHLLEGCVDYLAIGSFIIDCKQNRLKSLSLCHQSLEAEDSNGLLSIMNNMRKYQDR